MTMRPSAGTANPPFLAFSRFSALLLLAAAVAAWAIPPDPAAGADGLDARGGAELRLYLALAEACEMAYYDSRPGLESTPSGCVALVREDGAGNLIIAFRGSMLDDRAPKHRFSNLGGANIRRNYRDWVATNLKQTAGFLPRQYVEAASLVERRVRAHPADKLVFVTGHSKGGGAATYAFVAAGLSPAVSEEKARRMRCVTFNAAVVRERNWLRLFRRLDGGVDLSAREPGAGTIRALHMVDDPVSRIAVSEERRYVGRIAIEPASALDPGEQHGIRTMIDELALRVRAADRK